MFAKGKYLLAIGLLFLIPACVTGQATGASTVDIDATVEARLALIPTPTRTPQIVIQEVEVIVEKIVEKVVEVVVTSTPTPKPTATPTPLPKPTATPMPDASDYIDVNISLKSADETTDGVSVYTDVLYKDILVTNNHPTKVMRVNIKENEYASEGFKINNGGTLTTCIYANETNRFRRALPGTIINDSLTQKEELMNAFIDYHGGKLGVIPAKNHIPHKQNTEITTQG